LLPSSRLVLTVAARHLMTKLLVAQEGARTEEENSTRPVSVKLIIEGDAIRLHVALHGSNVGSRMDTTAAGTARPGIVDVRQRPAVLPQPLSDSDMSSDSDEEVPEADALADIRARLNEAVDEDEEKAAVVSSVQVSSLGSPAGHP